MSMQAPAHTISDKEFNIMDVAAAQEELNQLRLAHGMPEKLSWWQRLGDSYFEQREHRTKHRVSRKKYLWLCGLLGWLGVHRFYEQRYVLGMLYLALFWTGLPLTFAVVDWMIAFPIKAEQDGTIMI